MSSSESLKVKVKANCFPLIDWRLNYNYKNNLLSNNLKDKECLLEVLSGLNSTQCSMRNIVDTQYF